MEDPTIDWDHSSTDFSFDDKDDVSLLKPDVSEIRRGDDDE